MQSETPWQENSVFIEIGVQCADVALSLRHEGYSNYLGVSKNAAQVATLQSKHPELAEDLVHTQQRKVVRRNNAQVLILSGSSVLHLWKYRSVRHADCVAWRARSSPLALLGMLGCLLQMLTRRYSKPEIVSLQTPEGSTCRMFVTRVLRPKLPGQKSLHFIPHRLGITGLFERFKEREAKYVVLRWFDELPQIKPNEDVDLLVADESLESVLDILHSEPGIQPCDLYSERGLPRSDYCGTPYYPNSVAKRILENAVRHNDLCMVPSEHDYFHSLAYHAVYHKGLKSDLPVSGATQPRKSKSDHDYATILQSMAERLGIDVEISLEGLHNYLQQSGWGPSDEMLARLAIACSRNPWLQTLASRLEDHVHDQGLAVFVVRREAVERELLKQITDMVEDGGFEILATKKLSAKRIEIGASQTRGGNWKLEGHFDISGGPPAAVIIAYDDKPLPLTAKQKKKFKTRTNARLFVKEHIRDVLCKELTVGERFNALHSSDHAADALHLIETLVPELMEEVLDHLSDSSQTITIREEVRRAA
ncbi:hypothetical protein [Adhaeretor mobilis]|uniref:Uncharacterized protein n=1 Tax=Adhaeretor mobilis TaxID=1930276 RepID=A0A517MPP9_9BACT|nr:hypothetical protein [Adhaeretor mobilis]QDS96866.1 hypothetical protein HG15A2_01250 [Adhaeretor mobilis]